MSFFCYQASLCRVTDRSLLVCTSASALEFQICWVLSPYLLPSAWALHPLVQFCCPFVASKRSRTAVIGWHCGPALASCDKICCPVLGFFNACCTRMLQSPCKTSPLTALLFLQCLDSWLPLQGIHSSVEKLQPGPGPNYSSGALDRMPIFVSHSLFLSVDWISACLLPLNITVPPLLSSSLIIFPLF